MNESIVMPLTSDDVRNIRKKAGMTQKEFCEKFGFNINTFRHWERGDRAPSGAALAILNLLNISPEVVQGVNIRADISEDLVKDKGVLKEIVIKDEYQSVDDVLKNEPGRSGAVILALLGSIGFVYKKMVSNGDVLDFYAGHDPDFLRLSVRVDKSNGAISGEYENALRKAFCVISAIENELSSILFLPHEMRQKRINSVIKSIGVDENFYTTVLKNW